MAAYMVLSKWTAQGVQNVKQSPSRVDAARKAFEATGFKLKEVYMTLGQYDIVLVVEAPDDATFAKALLTVVAGGNIQTETLRAFTEDEYRAIVSSLP
ncbi:MAG TPA: GYD domain-containing protein [Alloacidobacterium sp.]|nr:GYD domain-containing protein [Alloacidobacterium sp.]